ncbi:MAG: ribonuclease HII [Saprospiraceae bacterium]|nr:ribonuclease HII [Saprospiraceae bacterium]MBK8282584.1 ribonuclease HII [Saprospiraceae bacterium]MBK8513785.1 ribonuclease HII [Saprospiraceae bacterium]MBK8778817.1 ribonuclease HII [Saprospiraceae bacterium]MBK9932364.1 ribonuclease HII [Saprospiraceae bacterium]
MKSFFKKGLIEAGVDEAGRGCLAGPVYAAAVILPRGFRNPGIDDSKKLNRKERDRLRSIIEKKAIHWAVAACDPLEIDRLNILWASVRAMHLALDQIPLEPDMILVDGNRFKPYRSVAHTCVIEGDAIYLSIAAASILAKTHRDEHMQALHQSFPQYGWDTNKGYPTPDHKKALRMYGDCDHHRKSFRWDLPVQGVLFE